MATVQELLDDAAANARATTITWDAFLEQVRTQAGFDYRSTQWYAAGADLEQLKSVPGVSLRFGARPFFKEFVVQVPGPVEPLLERLLAAGYHAGLPLGRWYPTLANCLSIAVTEKRTRQEMDGLVAALRQG